MLVVSDTGPVAGDAYEGYVLEQLQEERARKASLEQRGLAVITTSGTLVTLLFAISAFVLGGRYTVPGFTCGAVVVALAMFIAAACLGIVVNWPVNYSEPETDALQGLTADEKWTDDRLAGVLAVTDSRLCTLKVARERNGTKAWLLIAAMGLEVAAVAALGAGVAVALLAGQ